jgi:predicted metal-dependent hydrolase
MKQVFDLLDAIRPSGFFNPIQHIVMRYRGDRCACMDLWTLFGFGPTRTRRTRVRRYGSGAPSPLRFRDGQELSLLGRNFAIGVSEGSGSASRVRLVNERIEIALAQGLGARDRNSHVSALARRAISKRIQPELALRVGALNSSHFGFELGPVRIKDQRTRWGSYSKATNTISLNFRLLFAPPEILDYVIVHELAHIRELNHSRRFWNLVGTAIPEYRQRRKWLRENGGRLAPPKPKAREPRGGFQRTLDFGENSAAQG